MSASNRLKDWKMKPIFRARSAARPASPRLETLRQASNQERNAEKRRDRNAGRNAGTGIICEHSE
ncbi:MAG: hypothetical protein WD942_02350, partial [Dehalococcoidia bacterium]